MLAISLPPEIADRLTALSLSTGRSESDYIQEAILGFLDDLEDAQLAEQRLEDVRAGRSRIYSLDEVERELGLDD